MPAGIQRSTLPVEATGPSAGPPPPEPSLLETVGAGFRTTKDDIGHVQRERLLEAYRPVMQALEERGEGGSWWYTNPTAVVLPFQDTFDYGRVWQAIERQRERDPAAFAELPATREEFEQGVLTRQGERAQDLDVLARGSGVAGFVGALGAMPFDPVNVATAPIGSGAKTVAQAVLRGAIINSAIEATQQPGLALARERMGETLTGEEVALNIGAAAVFGGVLEGTPKALGQAIDANWSRLPEPLRERWAAHRLKGMDLADDPVLMADLAEAIVGPERLSTAEADAIAVARREGHVAEANPFRRDGAGMALHDELAAEMLGQVLRDVPLPGRPGPLPAQLSVDRPRPAPAASPGTGGALHGGIVRFFEEAGLSRALARGIAAGIEAESRSNPNIANPTSGAFGIGQWLGPRKKELFRRYGKNPSMREQLEFLLWELRGGDHGGASVLGAADEAEALRRYIVDFMRPAKGAETSGDLKRGMAALGRDVSELAIADGPRLRDDFGGDEAETARIQQALDEALGRADALASEQRTASEAGGDDPLLAALRGVVATPGQSLNRIDALAETTGFAEADLRRGLERLAGTGEITVNSATGRFMRKPPGGLSGPDDMLRFIARNGGISYDGLGFKARRAGHKGDDLRNTGELARFVPGAGPLLRPGQEVEGGRGGRGVDEMGELLWDAGYFGPPETTPRPSEADVLAAIEESIRTGQKRYSSFEATGAAPQRATGDDFAEPEPWADDAARDAYWARYDRIGDAALARYKAVLLRRDTEEIEALMREGTALLPAREPGPGLTDDELAGYIGEWLNRKIDEALDDAALETEDALYGFADSLDREAGPAAPRGAGRTAEPADTGEGPADAGAGGEADGRRLAELAPEQRAPFLDPDGEAAKAQAESLLHDARALTLIRRDDLADVAELVLANPRKNWQGVPDAEVEAGRLADGKWVQRHAWNSSDGGSATPFGHSPRFDSREAALRYGLERIANVRAERPRRWAEEQIAALDEAPAASPLDLGEAADPNIAARQRQQAQLGAEAPMRAPADQQSTLGFGLFGAADGVRLDAEGEARPLRDLLDEIDAEQAELKNIRDCL